MFGRSLESNYLRGSAEECTVARGREKVYQLVSSTLASLIMGGNEAFEREKYVSGEKDALIGKELVHVGQRWDHCR